MSGEQNQVSVPPVAADAAAIDWAALIALLVQLIQALFPTPTPTPPVVGGAGPEPPLDHAWRCRKTLLEQLRAAQCCAQHMQDCGQHPHGGGPGKAVPGV